MVQFQSNPKHPFMLKRMTKRKNFESYKLRWPCNSRTNPILSEWVVGLSGFISSFCVWGEACEILLGGHWQLQFSICTREDIGSFESINCDGVWDLLYICQTDTEYLLLPIN